MTFLSRLLSKLTPLRETHPEGDRLPLTLTPDEASTLYLAAKLMAIYAEGRRADEASQAQTYLVGILPSPLREDSEALGEVIGALRPLYKLGLDDPRLLALQAAIRDRRVVRMVYQGYRLEEEPTQRDVEPHTLSYKAGAWYVTGYCRLKQDLRTFRVSRIESINTLHETFAERFSDQRPHDPIEVRVRFPAESLMRVRESQHPCFRREEPALGETDRVMVYEVDSPDELLSWLLSWGAAAQVIEPRALREMILMEALKLVEQLD